MNMETCYRLLLNEVHRSSQTDIDMAMISIIKAMDFYKSFPFDFNNGWEQVLLPAGQETLTAPPSPSGFPSVRSGLPAGIRRPISITIVGTVTSGDVTTGLGEFVYAPLPQSPLIQVSIDQMWSMAGGVGELSVSAPSYPKFYAWVGDGSIRIYPRPFTDMVADVFFLKDAHRPRYKWESGGWAFEQLSINSDSNLQFWQWTALLPGFTNVWLENAEPMIRARARYELFINFYSDKGSAEIARTTLGEEEGRLRYEMTSAMVGNLSKTPSRL